MFANVWLLLSSLFYSLQLHSGSFPQPLTEEEEKKFLALSAQGDLEARNILVERNLRLVAPYYEELMKPAATPCGGRMGCTCLCTVTTAQKFTGMWC